MGGHGSPPLERRRENRDYFSSFMTDNISSSGILALSRNVARSALIASRLVPVFIVSANALAALMIRIQVIASCRGLNDPNIKSGVFMSRTMPAQESSGQLFGKTGRLPAEDARGSEGAHEHCKQSRLSRMLRPTHHVKHGRLARGRRDCPRETARRRRRDSRCRCRPWPHVQGVDVRERPAFKRDSVTSAPKADAYTGKGKEDDGRISQDCQSHETPIHRP